MPSRLKCYRISGKRLLCARLIAVLGGLIILVSGAAAGQPQIAEIPAQTSQPDQRSALAGGAASADTSNAAVQDSSAQAGADSKPMLPAPPVQHSVSDLQFDYYRDSDGNVVSTLTRTSDVTVRATTFTLRRETVMAEGPQQKEASQAVTLSAYGKPWKWLLVGGGIGVIRTQDGSSSLAGSLTSEATLRSMSIDLSVARGLLEANAQTIANHVIQTDLALKIWDDITERLGTNLEYHHRFFSDGNSEDDFSAAPAYTVNLRKTKLALSLSVEYAAFAQPTHLGYYAPLGLLTTQPAISWQFDRAGFYGLLKVGMGRSFSVAQEQWNPGFAGSGVAALGKRLTERTAAEWYLTAGRDALGMPSTWSSMNTGLKLNFRF